MNKLWTLALVLLGAAALAPAAPAAAAEGTRYVPLTPGFVVNYGPPSTKRLRYLKAEVSLQVSSSEAAQAVERHLPALRNALVLLLSSQEEAAVTSGAGREALSAEALAALQEVLQQEEGEPHLEAVLFTDFVVQR